VNCYGVASRVKQQISAWLSPDRELVVVALF